jgi:glyoxylase-like metal-dependent hydrolase (beta-lactamase superfamily II)
MVHSQYPALMREIAPGIHHWTAEHPDIGTQVSSYWLPRERVLLDPLAVPDEVDEVEFILLTNRLHRRDALEARERFGASLHVPRAGMHDWEGDPVEPYEPGADLAGGAVTVHEVGAISPDESALHIPSVKALAVADGVIHYGDELSFVSDNLMDDPEDTKRGLRDAYARLAAELDFDNLLTAHGTPVTGDARERLRDFART